jgi:hypothetical protein
LELTHQLIAIGLCDLLDQTQLIRVPLLQLPILRRTSHDLLLFSAIKIDREEGERRFKSLLELCSPYGLLFGVVLVNFLGQKRRPLIGLLQVAAEFLALATGVFYCQPENDSAVQTHTHERPSETNAGERKCTKLEGKKGKKEKKHKEDWKYVGV